MKEIEKLKLSKEMKKILSLGVEGGGLDVYERANKIIIESGSSGGILDEDPVRKWGEKFDTLESWWLHFTTQHGIYWICFHLYFTDVSVKDFVLQKVKNFDSTYFGNDFHKNDWLFFINDYKQ